MNRVGENVVRIEAQALSDLADRLVGPMAEAFNRGVELLFCCPGRVVVTGMGKSGLIARKIAATLSRPVRPRCSCIQSRRCMETWECWLTATL